MQASPTGCFRQGYTYDWFIPNTMINTTSLQLCQRRCQSTPACAHFVYWAFWGECWFADENAVEKPASPFLITGDIACDAKGMAPPPRCRTELPMNGFPGINGVVSNQAWPGSKQPYSLECWPKAWTGAHLACKKVTVLDDTTSDWPGKCSGLVERKSIAGADCSKDCSRNPLCQSWQLTPFDSCWQGLGRDCFVRENFQPRSAQRLQHGSVRVLMDLTGWQIVGLYKVFDNAEGYFPNVKDAITFCKHVCYSDIRCQYWSYAPNFGCWVEDASLPYKPGYPLTLDDAYRNTDFALDSVAGEYIQHYCEADDVIVYPPSPPPPLTGCLKRGIRFEPANMVFQHRTVESSYDACSSRCKNILNCVYFAYWPDGGCHVTDGSAREVTAENYEVISGPVNCDLTATTSREHPEAWLNKPKSLIPFLVSTAPPSSQDIQVVTIASIQTTIHNLDVSKLTEAESNLLKSMYAQSIAGTIGEPISDVKDAPKGMAARVALQMQMPLGTVLTAWVYNQPLTSDDVSILESKLQNREFVDSIKAATKSTLGTVHGGLMGPVMISKPLVSTLAHPVTEDVSYCDWWCSWWPLITALILALCVGSAVVGYILYDRNATKRNLLMGHYDHSEEELGDPDVWASEKPWQDSSASGSSPQRNVKLNQQRRGQFTA